MEQAVRVLAYVVTLFVAPGVCSSPTAPSTPSVPDPNVAKAAAACDAMRSAGDATLASRRAWPHLRDRRLERAIRQFYTREVLGQGIDDRRLEAHPLVLERGVTATAAAARSCADAWRAADPSGVVNVAGAFVADHRYVEVSFEFNDAADGEHAYTVFVDVTTLEVPATFYYGNFQP
jgi:hypothetical protein